MHTGLGVFVADYRFRKIAQPWFDLGYVVLPATIDKTPDVLRFRQYCEWSDKKDNNGKMWEREYASQNLLNLHATTKPHSNGLVLLDSAPDMPKLAVLDVDDMAQLPWVIEQFGDTPLKVTTGRVDGGIQLYYQCEPGLKYTSVNGQIGPASAWFERTTDGVGNGNWNTKIDVKSAALYVIAPGSVHQTGLMYKASAPITRELLLSLPVLDWQKLEGLKWKNCPRDHGSAYDGAVKIVAPNASGFFELDLSQKRGNFEYVDFATVAFPGWSNLLAFCDAKLPGQGKRKIGSPFHGSDSGERGGSGQVVRKGEKLRVIDYYEGGKSYYHRSAKVQVLPEVVTDYGAGLGSHPNVLVPPYGGSLNRSPSQVEPDESYIPDLATQTGHLVYDLLNPATQPNGRYDPASGSLLDDLDTTTLEPQVDAEWDSIGNQIAFCARGRTCSSVKRKPVGVVMINSKTPCNAYQCPSCGLLQRSCLQAAATVAMRPLRDAGWVGIQYTEHVSRSKSPNRKQLEYWVAADPANRQYLSIMQTPDNEGRRWIGRGIPQEVIPATATTIQYLCLYKTDQPKITGTRVSTENLEAVAAGFFSAVDPKDWEGHGRAQVLGGSRNIKHLIASLRDGAYGRNKKKNQTKAGGYERPPVVHNTSIDNIRAEVGFRTPFPVAVVHSKKDEHEVGFRRTMTESIQIVAPNPIIQALIEDIGISLMARVFDRMMDDGVFVGHACDLSELEWLPGSAR